MDKKLKQLFEYQKFEHNKNLDEVICNIQAESSFEMADGLLSAVAGGKKEEDKNNKKEEQK